MHLTEIRPQTEAVDDVVYSIRNFSSSSAYIQSTVMIIGTVGLTPL